MNREHNRLDASGGYTGVDTITFTTTRPHGLRLGQQLRISIQGEKRPVVVTKVIDHIRVEVTPDNRPRAARRAAKARSRK